MRSHVIRSQIPTFWGSHRYRLFARIYPTPAERQLIGRHRLEAVEIFHDPVREHFTAQSDAAHRRAKAHGLFVAKAGDAIGVLGAEIVASVAAIRGLRAFNITVADLLNGVTITHKRLTAIGEIETAVVDCIDHIARTVEAARRYSDEVQDLYEPANERPDAVRPADWPRAWRQR